ncbi:hypothetical protein GCM10009740_38560 [Terrabacter terrae]|uniref:DUF4396 domain-containing protein n=1 Tax=Terrabacter terrae TaxID=318434 RepID=A0ABP4KJH2_9MICO
MSGERVPTPCAGRGNGAAAHGLVWMAASATPHCLSGCAIGEVLGLVIGTAAGLSAGLVNPVF